MSESSPSKPSHASVYQAYSANTYLFGGNAPYVEEMYENYLSNPGSVKGANRSSFLSCGRPCLANLGSRSSSSASNNPVCVHLSAALHLQPSPGVSHRMLTTPRGVCEQCSMAVHYLGRWSGETCPVSIACMLAVTLL